MLDQFIRATSRQRPARWESFLAPLRTFSLIYPATLLDELEQDFGPLIDHLGRNASLYLPSAKAKQNMRVGSYGQSLLHLFSNAFEDPVEKGGKLRQVDILVSQGSL